jgi:hypothetical protein
MSALGQERTVRFAPKEDVHVGQIAIATLARLGHGD